VAKALPVLFLYLFYYSLDRSKVGVHGKMKEKKSERKREMKRKKETDQWEEKQSE